MLVNCNECKKEVSDTAKQCIHCGAEIPNKFKDILYTIFGFLFFIFIIYSLIHYFFFQGEEPKIEIIEQELKENFFTNPTLSFRVKNLGPDYKFSYYVSVGDNVSERFISDRFCSGVFEIKENAEKSIVNNCSDLNIEFKRYSLSVEPKQ